MMAIQNQNQRNHKQQQSQPQPLQQLQQQQHRNQKPPQEPPMSATCNATTTGTTTTPTAAAAATTTTNNNASNGGPRVSFNRDVHVKRIGKRPSESTNYETTNLQPLQAYHQLPAEFSADSIRKEAALVLAQAERHKSRAENGDNIPIFKVKTKRSGGDAATTPNKFHSLPTRKKKPAPKPVSRSVSDAEAKKPTKRPSIFSIFSRKSDSNVNQAGGDPRFEESGGRRLVRSKSDVGSTAKVERKSKKALKDHKQQPATANGSSKQLSTPLSPIFENALTEEQFEEQFNRERRKSEAITDREKHESGLNELLQRSRHQAEVDGSLLGKTPISTNIKDKILSLQEGNLNENMHSSQLPAQRLPLTKGITVNGMIKRLSRERFSPPPPITGPVFSYIRPNEGITYAQLDHSDDQQPYHNTYNRRDQMRSPVHETHTPVREYRSPVRDIRDVREIRSMERITTRPSIDQTDFVHTSQPTTTTQQQHKSARSNYNHNSRIIIESPMNMSRDSFSPVAGPTTIRISSSHSPSPWQQLSPRNLSDEDEGLGFETRKYFDEDYSVQVRSKSPPEPPIVPVIRSITPPPVDIAYPHAHNYRSDVREEPVDNLGYRRAQLESRILTRRFGDNTLERDYMPQRASQPELSRHRREEYQQQQQHHVSNSHQRYLTPERDEFGSRFHKPQTNEILQKYSPERSHLDMVSPSAKTTVKSLPKTETKTSRYKHTKYYDDGAGGVKEVYERETRTDGSGQPRVRESRHRERLDSLNATQEHSSTERPQLTDYEPKSLDSQYTNTELYRSSPENMKRYEMSNGLDNGYLHRKATEEHWQSSLKRDKLQQRSFDKGDSGIENDFRKESFNGDLTNRWRKRTYADDVQACEAFLKKERRHTENLAADRYAKATYVYRERSIDDGSHYDPHLDKYPTATSTLRRTTRSTERQTQTASTSPGQETLKRNKKVGGFEKVKQLFTGGVVSGSGGGGGGGSSSSSSKKENVEHSSLSGTQTLPKDKYMVKEEEMRSRYREHRGSLQNELREPKTTDISMRRRLSTPKASPLLIKRTEPKKKPSPLVQKNITEKPEKTSWFKSLDRRTKSKSKEKLDVSVNGQNETSSMKRSKPSRTATVTPPIPPKNLRFFGDTDLDSNPPTVSRVTTTPKSRPSVATNLNRSQKYSQSAFHLDRINAKSPQPQAAQTSRLQSERPTERTSMATARHKSSSMHNLENDGTDEIDFRKRRHYSRSRDLDDISESGSETEEKHKRQNGFIGSAASRSLSREKLDRSHRYDDHAYRKSSERQTPTTLPNGELHTLRKQHNQNLTGPPKPLRSVERRGMTSLSRDRERYPAESSGTEGESSLHSQRSIVYLHATTVGAIPQPYHLSGRSISRDDLRSNKSKNQPLQPMTRTVSRSVSMLAPWKPKLISEGYEINYSQEQNKRMATLPRKQQQQQHLTNGNTSTLTRNGKKSEAPLARSRRHELMKDDQSSLRNSSTTSASKSALSSNLHANTRRKIK